MAPLQATANLVRDSISSTSTCTPAIVTSLSELLLPTPSVPKTIASSSSKKPTKANTGSTIKPKVGAAKGRAKKVVDQENIQIHEDELSPKERSILATEVINATLKALTEATKAPAQTVRKQVSSKDLVKAAARKTLRRSSSVPQSPLQPRSLNRVASYPNIATRNNRSSSSASSSISGYRATGECARIAFACLRTLQASKSPDVALPPLQLENGMSVLVGKLLLLGLDDLAIKEVRVLKKRLLPEIAQKKPPVSKTSTTSTPQTLSELLDFGTGQLSGAKLALVITTQLQILRLMASSRKHAQIEAALPLLDPKSLSSPTSLLMLASKETKDRKQMDKIARQFQSLSEILLSLCPSVSSSDDAIATEPRLSVCPEVAIQIQAIGLHNRAIWWSVAGHKGDASKELFDPLLRCLSAFSRRSICAPVETYQLSSTIFHNFQIVFSDYKLSSNGDVRLSLPSIYRVLGSSAKDAGMFMEAVDWTEKYQESLNPKDNSEVKRCSVVARLVSLKLRKSTRDTNEEELLMSLLEGLEQPFKGDASEIDDLIAEVSYTRRAAIAILAKARDASNAFSISEGLRDMCESLIFLCPRLLLRYLGVTPDAKSPPKEVVRHDQRRQLITVSALHSIDSVLFLIRVLSAEERLAWDLMDSKLQDCLLLHDRLDVNSRGVVMDDGNPPPAYYVRISNVYYSQFLTMRRNSSNPKDGQQFRAIRRAIDSMRGRSQHEKRAASLWTKLERLAEFCKQVGRYDELLKTLTSLRDELVEQGILSAVAKTAISRSLSSAWTANEETSALSRTIQSMIKVELRYLKSSGLTTVVDLSWSEAEKAAVLENQVDMLSNQSSSAAADLLVKVFQELLKIYDGRLYPLRRLRVLLQLFRLDLEQESEIVPDLSVELSSYSQGKVVIDGTNDEALRDYFTSFKTFAATSLQLRKENPDLNALRQGLSTWSAIREKSNNVEEVEGQIESVASLLFHLQSIGDYLEMKGHDSDRLATLRLITDFNQLSDATPNADALVSSFSALGSQWLQLGYSGKAGIIFDKAKDYNRNNGVSLNTSLQLQLSYSEYLLVIGNHEKCEEQLSLAKTLFSQNQSSTLSSRTSPTAEEKIKKYILVSNAYMIYSMLALERGSAQLALGHAKLAIRLLRRAWAYIEDQTPTRSSTPDSSVIEETGNTTEDSSQITCTDKTISFSTNGKITTPLCGPRFWSLITPLFNALNYVGNLYAHHGMLQETVYYTQEAHKLVSAAGSKARLAMASALLGSTYLKGGVLDKGSECLMLAQRYSSELEDHNTRENAILFYHTGTMYGLAGDRDAEIIAYKNAETILQTLARTEHIQNLDTIKQPPVSLEDKMAQLSIAKPKPSRKAPVRAKVVVRRKAAAQPSEVKSSVTDECPQLDSLKANLLRRKARAFISMKQSVEALEFLHEASSLSTSQTELIEQSIAMAKQLLLQSMDQMAADPVYSVLQESTISFPAVAGVTKPDKFGEKLSVVKVSPPKKVAAKNSRTIARSKSPSPDSCFDKLRQAQEHLIDVHSIAISVASLPVIHSITTLLNSVSILLSASWQAKGRSLAHPGFASCSIETARTLALRRERRVVQAESSIPLKVDSTCWPTLPQPDGRRSSIAGSSDMARFQQNYIDIIPTTWTAISISLSDSRDELSITKFQAGHSPFVLRLPLSRNTSMDADEEVFGFEQGQMELLEIIQLANESAHDARDMSGKDSKAAWWEEREALDARLRDLLENIEKVWLGGFTGIFSQHARRTDLLARFQKSFQNILDKYLPSRRKTGKRGASPKIALDSRILELFVGLGDASDEDSDFSEPLTDLLNFVVDVLQFHGELNAYSEIDFDSIVIETHDALRGYHAALNSSGHSDEGRHTILILDKSLHAFPWESLPCMEGLAVSRLPSLGCLRDQILRQQTDLPVGAPEGQYIDRDNGAFILNPSGDLKNTQATFTKGLQSLNWNGVVRREPTQDEIKSALMTKDLYLYFGHGSGAQYIRAKEIRKLEKCAVSWLMGCSSGALTEAGEFEPYGPAINYMHAGCPALVATLWDVTDKDIDRFAKSAFEHWGLFEKEAVGKGKGKRKLEAVEEQEPRVMSLVEAVAKGREACNLKYLNAAAVCVYGVPVYFR